jgi:hypothetical protein
MRKLTLSQFTTLILMTFLFSCDNQDQLLTTEQPDKIVLAARLWFETEKPEISYAPELVPTWNKAVVADGFIEVPYTIHGKSPLPRASGVPLKNSGRKRLVLAGNGNSYSLFIISYIPSLSFKGKIQSVNLSTYQKDFDGTITIQEKDHELQRWEVRQGVVIRKTLISNITSKPEGRTKDCTWWEHCTDWYQCYNGECQFLDRTCEYGQDCDDGGGDDGGGGGGDEGGGDEEGGSGGGGSSSVPFYPSQVIDLGDRPLSEFQDKCVGLQNTWNTYPNNEVAGYVTWDGQLLVTNIIGQQGGAIFGTYYYNGVTYYPYPMTQGPPSNTYAGMQQSAGYYLIPVLASFHTHSPCISDGTDGVSHPVGTDDRASAAASPHINHWVIGCDAIAQFDSSNPSFYNIQTGSLSVLCSNVQ